MKRRTMTMANSGVPYPIRCPGGHRKEPATPGLAEIELAGVPLGAFPGTQYDELTFDLASGDLYVLCTDGVFEAQDAKRWEFGSERLMQVIDATRHLPARDIVDSIFAAVQEFRGDTAPNDDMTAVAVKITT